MSNKRSWTEHEMLGGALDGKKLHLVCPGEPADHTPEGTMWMDLSGKGGLMTFRNDDGTTETVVSTVIGARLYKHSVRDDGTHTYELVTG